MKNWILLAGLASLANPVSAVREARPETRVLVMSGYTHDTVTQNGAASGLSFLEKPCTPRALALKVREVLDTKVV